MSEEEKQRRLNDMMSAADQLEGARDKRVRSALHGGAGDDAPIQAADRAKFLDSMQKNVYEGATSMADRLQEKRHYSQRLGDQDGGFMRPK